MTEELRCGFCSQEAEGLTLYGVAGVFRLMVCEPCYGLLVAKEGQPHAQPMRRLHRLLWLSERRWCPMRVVPVGDVTCRNGQHTRRNS